MYVSDLDKTLLLPDATLGTYTRTVLDDRSLPADVDVELGDEIHQLCHVILGEDVYTRGRFRLERTHAGGTKAQAVRAVAAGAGADRIVCFGANLNDLSMLAVADQSYAASNAVREFTQRRRR